MDLLTAYNTLAQIAGSGVVASPPRLLGRQMIAAPTSTYSVSLENDRYISSEHGKTLPQIRAIVKDYKANPCGWTIKVHGPDGMEMLCVSVRASKRTWRRSTLSQARYLK
jgi:hypothetical protein